MTATNHPADQLPPHITRDLSRELQERVSKTTRSMTLIVEHPLDAFMVSLGGLVASVAISGAHFSVHAGRKFDPIDVGVAMLEEMRNARGSVDPDAVCRRLAGEQLSACQRPEEMK